MFGMYGCSSEGLRRCAKTKSINPRYASQSNVSHFQPGRRRDHSDSRYSANSFWRQKAARTRQGSGPGYKGVQESDPQRFRRDAGSAGRNFSICAHPFVCRCPACCALERHHYRPSPLKTGKKRVLILGGGFGGVYAAMRLEKLLAAMLARQKVEICLVSRDNFFLFTPMLHEIAASDLEITNIVNPLRKLLRRVEVIVGDVDQIDLPNQSVLISHGQHDHSHKLSYDHLVLALGSITNFFDLPGLAPILDGVDKT